MWHYEFVIVIAFMDLCARPTAVYGTIAVGMTGSMPWGKLPGSDLNSLKSAALKVATGVALAKTAGEIMGKLTASATNRDEDRLTACGAVFGGIAGGIATFAPGPLAVALAGLGTYLNQVDADEFDQQLQKITDNEKVLSVGAALVHAAKGNKEEAVKAALRVMGKEDEARTAEEFVRKINQLPKVEAASKLTEQFCTLPNRNSNRHIKIPSPQPAAKQQQVHGLGIGLPAKPTTIDLRTKINIGAARIAGGAAAAVFAAATGGNVTDAWRNGGLMMALAVANNAAIKEAIAGAVKTFNALDEQKTSYVMENTKGLDPKMVQAKDAVFGIQNGDRSGGMERLAEVLGYGDAGHTAGKLWKHFDRHPAPMSVQGL